MNRYWQHFFGHGIVRTSENLGVQGELPSHPRLLDWLACEFVDSGWDVKRLHRSIVLSHAYQQSSVSSPELQELDPDNRLFARASRLRLPAFTIRDQALSASGLLVHQMHGRPAKPYMPPKIWSAISNNKYVQDTGSNLYRRSVYTYWRRTIPPPIMMTLNAGDREVCTVRQARTNTPLQALSLLNNVTFVEAARVLAQRVLARHGDPSTAISTAHRLVTGKTPAAETQQQLESDFDSYLQYYRSQPDAAADLLNTGEAAKNPHLQNADVAAMILVTSTLLNLDQCLTRE